MQEDKLFFSSVTESRGVYFVEYSPPHHGYRFASLHLTYTEKIELNEVAKALEEEASQWLKKYPVPIMASAFDETGSLIDLDGVKPESHVICFYGNDGKTIEAHWALINEQAIPSQALNRDYLLDIYSNFKRRTSSEIRKEVEKSTKERRLGMRVIFAWVIVVPALVAIIEFFIPQWFAALVLLYSLSMALIKGLRMKGKLKKSKTELAKEEEQRRMRHHHYHCEKNPEAFQRLKLENFEQWARERIMKEAELAKARTDLRAGS